MGKRWECRYSHNDLTTVLTTTTVALPDTSTYTTVELASCLVTPPARAYGSQVHYPLRIRRAARIAWSEPRKLV
ncbi:MAG: hypothetical protein QOJ56_3358 [Mycobacterium sp.]|nr:hypothetical protein [Mycobacterium sp.]